MTPRLSTGPRLCGIVLLLLMVSPLTAPFSTCDLYDLFDGPRPGGAAVLQSKPAASDPIAALAAPVGLEGPQLVRTPAATLVTAHSGWRSIRHRPLRI